MMFKLKSAVSEFVRPRVTPDPDQAAQLLRKIQALSYNPSNGFHRDMRQDRQCRFGPRGAR
jgi:hypothetical protein